MACCRVCSQEILWGHLPTGWKPLDPEPSSSGLYAFLDEDKIIRIPSRWLSFEDIPAELRYSIQPNMIEFWRGVVDGPRFNEHNRDCRRLATARVSSPLKKFEKQVEEHYREVAR